MEHVAAVYRLFNDTRQLLYVGVTKDFGRRWKQHAAEQPWWGEVHSQDVVWFTTRRTALEAEAGAIRWEGPLCNKAGSPWQLVKDGGTGFYVIPKTKVKTVYRFRSCTAREHAIQLANLLKEGEERPDPKLCGVLRALAPVLAEYLQESVESLAAVDIKPESWPAAEDEDPRRIRMRSLLAQLGEQGASAGELTAFLGGEGRRVPRETVHRWLAGDERQGLVRRPGIPHRKTSRWIWAAALAE